jgi:CxxC motif-containing protein (DUF1111 family)
MHAKHPILLILSWAAATMATSGDTRLQLVPMTELSWPTTPGNIYQLQRADSPGAPWTDLGQAAAGDGSVLAMVDPAPAGQGIHRVLETVPGIPAAPALPVNGGFETAAGDGAANWTVSGNQPPTRTAEAAHSDSFGMRCRIVNVGSSPGEGGLSQRIATEGGTVEAGRSYNFSFRAKQVSVGPSYIQQYEVQWFNSSGTVLGGGTGLVNFSGSLGTWVQITRNNLVAPVGAADARVFFRFVTGAVLDGHGEVYIDDVVLDSGVSGTGTPEVVNPLPVESRPVAALNWLSEPGKVYHPTSSGDLLAWDDISPAITGDGSIKSIMVPMNKPAAFFRLEIPGPGTPPPDPGNDIAALFGSTTVLEAETTIHTPQALITRVGDRARDRHAREDMFRAYDHYLPWYWEQRTMGIEIIDRVAKGGNGITVNYQTLAPLSAPEFRAFFRGLGTVAEYHFNLLAPLTGPNLYTATLNTKLPENRPLQIGDRMEIEISMFLQAPANGRSNYYGTTMLYIVGQGIVPWQKGAEIGITGIVNSVNRSLDSYPLPETAWLGGKTTLPYQYSDEPAHRFKQIAGNISPDNIQPFMLGRRLHHTDFGNGSHSEPGNPVFSAHVGKLGPKFIARSCVECHVNNGRALPPAIGAPMFQSVVKVATDPLGTPHPSLGSVLQPRTTSGSPEGGAVISSYTYTNGQYADGTPYTLRKPNYTFQGVTPSHFSVRLSPPLVGMGLLEAVAEETILAMADPDDSNGDGISGRIRTLADPENNNLQRLGRFTAKGGQAKVKHQIAGALNIDMGVPSSIFPVLDGETTPQAPEISDASLDEMTRYIALLGVAARRSLNDAQALDGEQLFQSASCTNCHTPTLTTSPYHPMAELRNQTIHPYTDLLLHDMGPGLADNMGEDSASGSEWRTAPLWNIGLTAGVSGGEAYLHDGRARTIEEAILWHGGEAEAAKNAFLSMSAPDRAALVKFIKSL